MCETERFELAEVLCEICVVEDCKNRGKIVSGCNFGKPSNRALRWAFEFTNTLKNVGTKLDPKIKTSRLKASPVDVRFNPTSEQIDSTCLSYRHDFGLLSEYEQNELRLKAKLWLSAWEKELFNA